MTVLMMSVTVFTFSQSKKEMKHHRAMVDSSRKNLTAIVSLDSFFCSGVKYAIVSMNDRSAVSGTREYFLKDLKSLDTLISISVVTEGNNPENNFKYSHFTFPALNSECDVMNKTEEKEIFDIICKNKLLNIHGLDTMKAETFVTIKGTVRNSQKFKQYAAVNYKLAERNRKASTVLKGNDIYQDSVIIGSYDEITVDGPGGVKLQQIQVFNPQKQTVSISTETGPGSREWRTITHPDYKYHQIHTSAEKDQYLFDILGFLIMNLYL